MASMEKQVILVQAWSDGMRVEEMPRVCHKIPCLLLFQFFISRLKILNFEKVRLRGIYMHRLTSKLILFKDIEKNRILSRFSDLCERFEKGNDDKVNLISDIYTEINHLLEISTQYGFDKNLWHNYLAFLLGMTENPFTLVSEKVGLLNGTVNEFAKNDFSIFKQLFDYDFSKIENDLGINCFTMISHYQAVEKKEHIYNRSVSEKIQLLSASIEQASSDLDVYDVILNFYKTYGVGKLGLNKAFRILPNDRSMVISPITSMGSMTLNDLVGYEMQKEALIRNTKAFIDGYKANNVLLYGDAGTGKSTSIKAILNQYYEHGLRMIEVYKHEFKYLAQIIDEIKNRNYRFIIFMDDLSFEEFEIDYKYLKAVIEGGLESKPENVLIYATSNRRHLIRETWGDRSDMSHEDVHHSDTMQEKLSLADRFGISIGYYKPSRAEYYDIVKTLAQKHPAINISEEELLAEADKWEMRHGGVSGRTAQQFMNYLVGNPAHEKLLERI